MRSRTHGDLAIGELVKRALAEQVEATTEGRDEELGYLLALHQRTDRETFDRASRLASSVSREERKLGTRILKELGPWANRTFMVEAVPFLRGRLVVEDDPDVLAEDIMALAWQGDVSTRDDILRFANDERDAVRSAAINNLDHYIGSSGDPSDLVLTALLKATSDDDAGNRYSAVYDVATCTGCAGLRVRDALRVRLADPDHDVRDFAAAGLARSDQGWDELRSVGGSELQATLREVRIGNATGWLAFRLIARTNMASHTVVVFRGERFTWSELAYVDLKTWARWRASVESFVAGGPVVEFEVIGDQLATIKLRLEHDPAGAARVSGSIADERTLRHETLSWRWDEIERSDLERLISELNAAEGQ